VEFGDAQVAAVDVEPRLFALAKVVIHTRDGAKFSFHSSSPLAWARYSQSVLMLRATPC
jgi:hypothetical protein